MIATLKNAETSRPKIYYLMINLDPKNPEHNSKEIQNWDQLWNLKDGWPDYAVFSSQGEHRMRVQTSDITVAGGYFRACMQNTVGLSIESYFQESKATENQVLNPLTIHLPMDSIYVGDQRNLLDQFRDNYASDPIQFKEYLQNVIASIESISGVTSFRIELDGKELFRLNETQKNQVHLKFWSTNKLYLHKVRGLNQ